MRSAALASRIDEVDLVAPPNAPQVEDDQPEAAGAERVGDVSWPDPQGARERHAGGGRSFGIERVVGIDPGDGLPGVRRAGGDAAGEPGAPRAAAACQLRAPTPWQATLEDSVQGGQAGGQPGDATGVVVPRRTGPELPGRSSRAVAADTRHGCVFTSPPPVKRPARRSSQRIPYSFSLRCSCILDSPSTTAARDTLPPCCRSTSAMWRASNCARASRSCAPGGLRRRAPRRDRLRRDLGSGAPESRGQMRHGERLAVLGRAPPRARPRSAARGRCPASRSGSRHSIASGAMPSIALAVACAACARKRSTSTGMSSARSRSGGRRDRGSREPVEQVLPETSPAATSAERSRLRRRDHAHVDLARSRVADAADLALLEDAQQLGLHGERHARRSRRGTACRRPRARRGPSRSSVAPVNAPRTWPKSSLSSSVSGMARAVDRDERPSRRAGCPRGWRARRAPCRCRSRPGSAPRWSSRRPSSSAGRPPPSRVRSQPR